MPDWNAIRAEYVETDISIYALSKKHNLAHSTVQGHQKREKWDEQREEYSAILRRKAAEKSAEANAKNIEIAARIKQKMLRKLEAEIDAMPDAIGSETRQNLQERVYDDSEQAKGRLSKIKDVSKAYRFSDLVASYIRLTADMVTAEDMQTPDDGFLAALSGTAADDWSDGDD